jgi:hypothetical protein
MVERAGSLGRANPLSAPTRELAQRLSGVVEVLLLGRGEID